MISVKRPGPGYRSSNPLVIGVQDFVQGNPYRNPFADRTREHFVYEFAWHYGEYRLEHQGAIFFEDIACILAAYCPACKDPHWKPKNQR